MEEVKQSSANRKSSAFSIRTSLLLSQSSLSLKKVEKKRGPSIEPCGTPGRIRRGVDSWCPTWTV